MKRANDARAAMTNVPPEIFQTIVNLLQFTMNTKPHMVERVAVMIGQLMMDWNILGYHKEMLDKQVEMYEAGKFPLDIDKSAGMIPAKFDMRVKEVMPVLYKRLSTELDYKPAIQEAMVAIMKDFLVRWGGSFETFEDFHMTYLNELCDRHIERWNQRYAEKNGSFEDNVLTLTAEQTTHFRFVREVLVAVEQDLRGELRVQPELEQTRGLATQSVQ
jgi:hypothetical protein